MANSHGESSAALMQEMLAGYTPVPGRHDEMMSPDGELRPVWQSVLEATMHLGLSGLEQRQRDAQRLLRTDGMTWRAPAAFDSTPPWRLDPLPVVLHSDEWATVENGLIQRAELMAAILADLYGSRRLLHDGHLPAELLLADPDYLRPCIGMSPRGGSWLHLHAADLARSEDGALHIIADHTAAPDGMGHALEARVTLSRLLPSLFRNAHPHRLRRFFRTLRETLARLAPEDADTFTTAVLSRGTSDSGWHEDAYLAHYLGYQLAEGRDLMVRDDRLWLRTVSGLQPIHVLLRRLADRDCDPLELNRQSMRGTPGLLQMLRTQRAASINPVGSALAQSPALRPFLPTLCEHLLNEPLRLPMPVAWWCGDPGQYQEMQSHWPAVIVHAPPPDWQAQYETVAVDQLSPQARDALAARIRQNPIAFVAEKPLRRSTVPVITEGGLQPRPLEMRTFAVTDEHAWYVMPGGVGRTGGQPDSEDIAPAAGGASKDVWVIASEPDMEQDVVPVLRRAWPFPHREGAISRRLADNLFWLGRYLERADMQTRLLREATSSELETGGMLTGELSHYMLDITGAPPAEAITTRLGALLASSAPGRLAFNLGAIQRAARAAQDRLNQDAWRLINNLTAPRLQEENIFGLQGALEDLITRLAAIRTLTFDGMQTDHGRRLLGIGLRLERALQGLWLLRHTPVPAMPRIHERAGMLYSAAAINPNQYRQPELDLESRAGIIYLLLQAPDNPRAVGALLTRLDQDLAEMYARQSPAMAQPAAQTAILEARKALDQVELDKLTEPGELGALCIALETGLKSAAEHLADSFLRDHEQTRQLLDLQTPAQSVTGSES